jgi:hypothetical protein
MRPEFLGVPSGSHFVTRASDRSVASCSASERCNSLVAMLIDLLHDISPLGERRLSRAS